MDKKLEKYVVTKQIIFEPEKFVAARGDFILTDFKNFSYFKSNGSLLYRSDHSLNENCNLNKVICDNEKFKKVFKAMLVANKEDANCERLKNDIYQATEKSIIVGGCGRSGTTLLLSILSSHPEINIFEETFYFYPLPMRLNELEKRISLTSSKIWCEKTPKNVLVFDQIKNILKDKCKIIHMVRDGRDVITSVHPSRQGKYWVPIERWIDDVKKGLEFSDSKIVKYENLVLSPEKTIKELMDYLEIDFNKKMLSHEIYGLKNSSAWMNSAQTINRQSLGKWKRPEHKKIVDIFMSNIEAKKLLERLGYET